MKELYHIGIIDDDPSKITQMITMIRLCCDDEDGQPLKEKYANYKLDPIEITLARRKILCKRFSTESRMRKGSARTEGWTPSLPKSNGELSGMRAVRRECQATAVEY